MINDNRNVKKYIVKMSNFAEFLHQFGPELRQNIRKSENIEKKLINAELALVFNETCQYDIYMEYIK